MKKVNIKIAGLALLAAVGFTACSTDFLEEKKNYDLANPALYDDYAGCIGRVNDCYSFCLPNPNGNPDWRYTSTGKNDDWSKCTEEFSGFGIFVNPLSELNTLTGDSQPDYFQGSGWDNIQNNAWGLIRNVNDAIIGIQGSNGITQEQKDELLGQLYFLRAWRYFLLWKWYGGVPIVKDLVPIEPGDGMPRNTSREVFEFIMEDLNTSADLLEASTGAGQWAQGDNYGRITTGTALAMKTRVLAWWCSPIFNRENDQNRYEEAYNIIVEDLPRIEAGNYGQHRSDGIGNAAKDWANMFSVIGAQGRRVKNEAVFLARFNSIPSGGTPDYARSNPWEHSARPSNAMGGGGVTPSAMMVDLFPMADGKRPASYDSYTNLEASQLPYDSQHPFLYRDTRFYRTFGFPGIYWPMQGDPMNADNMNPYANGDYQLWNYVWYIDETKVNDPLSSETYGADNLLANAKGMYVIKRTSIGDNHRYIFDAGFKRSYQSWMEMRYTEVMLNYAEIACGAGHPEVALAELQKIRFMAGYNDSYNKTMSDGTTLQYENYGLPLGLDGDAQKCMQAIIYERQIEFAYEGKRFDDMRRWLLFDGGTGFATIGAKALTGWGGNTCTYLGFKPFNGQRRGNMEFQVKPSINKGVGGKTWEKGQWDNMPDPVAQTWIAAENKVLDDAYAEAVKKKVEELMKNDPTTYPDEATAKKDAEKLIDKPVHKGWTEFRDWRKGFAVNYNSNGRHGNSDKLDNLLIKLKTNFYEPYLQRKDKKGDALTSDNTTEGMVVTYLPRYYFLGLTSAVQAKNPLILQTVGWEDHYGRGEFYDPAAE